MVSLKGKEGSNLFLGKRKNFFVLEMVGGNVTLYKMFYDEKELSCSAQYDTAMP